MRPAGAAAGVCVCDGWGNWVYGVPWIHLIQKAGSILLNANPLFQQCPENIGKESYVNSSLGRRCITVIDALGDVIAWPRFCVKSGAK
nr:uncharacterized protein LOC127298808 isoform X3 [Lolium perenne]